MHGADSGLRKRKSRTALTTVVLALLAALIVVGLALGAAGKVQAQTLTPNQKLAALTVRAAGTMDGYSRDLFPHWSDAIEYGWTIPAGTPDPSYCDARDGALIRDGQGTERIGAYCDVNYGTWVDPYGGYTYHDPSDIDIDHIVPLANAWRSGASSWTIATRERFANARLDVLSVDDGLNASKGDKGPEAWKPPRSAYHCTYARKWINIKYYWTLSVTSAEKTALKSMLSTCP